MKIRRKSTCVIERTFLRSIPLYQAFRGVAALVLYSCSIMLFYTLYSDVKETFPCGLAIARRLYLPIYSLTSDTRLRLSERTTPHRPFLSDIFCILTVVQDRWPSL